MQDWLTVSFIFIFTAVILLLAISTAFMVGRNGMHKYNNQDHAMMTAILTAKNIIAGEQMYDPWRVNQDAEYHESGSTDMETGGRAVPRKLTPVAPLPATA